jgi:hypothetical protein
VAPDIGQAFGHDPVRGRGCLSRQGACRVLGEIESGPRWSASLVCSPRTWRGTRRSWRPTGPSASCERRATSTLLRNSPEGSRSSGLARGVVSRRSLRDLLNHRQHESRSDGCRSGSRSRGLALDGLPHRTGNSAKNLRQFCEDPVVELAGIEPASSSVEPGLLRVQSVRSLFSAPGLARTRPRQAQSRNSPAHPPRHGVSSKSPR